MLAQPSKGRAHRERDQSSFGRIENFGGILPVELDPLNHFASGPVDGKGGDLGLVCVKIGLQAKSPAFGWHLCIELEVDAVHAVPGHADTDEMTEIDAAGTAETSPDKGPLSYRVSLWELREELLIEIETCGYEVRIP
jgi:hypothetical protein